MKISKNYYILCCLTCAHFFCLVLYGQNVLNSNTIQSSYETKIVWNNKILVCDTVLFHFQNKPWKAQPRVQKLLEFNYQFDTIRLKDVLLSQSSYDFPLKKLWKQKYRKKKNFSFLSKSERTGYILNPSYFYFHPIRSGLYNKTFWAPHPYVEFKAFSIDKDTFDNNLWIPQLGVVEMTYFSKKELIIDENNFEGRLVLKITAKSRINDEKYNKIKNKNWYNGDKNDVQLNVVFSLERGFEFCEYIFPSGTRIEYNLISIDIK